MSSALAETIPSNRVLSGGAVSLATSGTIAYCPSVPDTLTFHCSYLSTMEGIAHCMDTHAL